MTYGGWTEGAGRFVLITGSDCGIGQAIAQECANVEYDVVVTYRSDLAGAEETGRSVEAASQKSLVSHLDVSDEASVAALFDKAERELGVPFILVNNAGVGGAGKPVAEPEIETFDRTLKTDLDGPYFCCREIISSELP